MKWMCECVCVLWSMHTSPYMHLCMNRIQTKGGNGECKSYFLPDSTPWSTSDDFNHVNAIVNWVILYDFVDTHKAMCVIPLVKSIYWVKDVEKVKWMRWMDYYLIFANELSIYLEFFFFCCLSSLIEFISFNLW